MLRLIPGKSINLGLNNIYFETIENQCKYYRLQISLVMDSACLLWTFLACYVAGEGGEGQSKVEG